MSDPALSGPTFSVPNFLDTQHTIETAADRMPIFARLGRLSPQHMPKCDDAWMPPRRHPALLHHRQDVTQTRAAIPNAGRCGHRPSPGAPHARETIAATGSAACGSGNGPSLRIGPTTGEVATSCATTTGAGIGSLRWPEFTQHAALLYHNRLDASGASAEEVARLTAKRPAAAGLQGSRKSDRAACARWSNCRAALPQDRPSRGAATYIRAGWPFGAHARVLLAADQRHECAGSVAIESDLGAYRSDGP
jgi:hypothetical protein